MKSADDPFREEIRKEMQELEQKAQRRSCITSETLQAGWLLRDGQRLLNLASNDYLGMAQQPQELAAPAYWGATASRLIVGSGPQVTEFEKEFAAFKGTERCLVFGSGYMANVGVISALVGRHDLIFSDRLNHASIVDGAILSRARLLRYPHRDMNRLEDMLRKHQHRPGKKLIVTDSIFSMDGTIAPLQQLVELKQRYGALLMVDEAHSGGVYGNEGKGLVQAFELQGQVDLQMGTFSKAYGCYGAYIAGEQLLLDYIANKARSFIYTTALPPVLIEQIYRNWQRVKEAEAKRQALRQYAEWFRQQLQVLGLNTGQSETQIVPIVLGDNETALRFGEVLQRQGIAAVAIRPPTVPEGSARIRFTLMSTHSKNDLQWALRHIQAEAGRMGIL